MNRSLFSPVLCLLACAPVASAAEWYPHLPAASAPWVFEPRFYYISGVVPVGDTIDIHRESQFGEPVMYRYALYIDNELFASAEGKPLHISIPDRYVGAKARIETSVRTGAMPSFTLAESREFPVAPRVLTCYLDNTTPRTNEFLTVAVLQGINPQFHLPAGTAVHFVDDQNGKYINTTLIETGHGQFHVPVQPQHEMKGVAPITLTVSSGIRNQIPDEQYVIVQPEQTWTANPAGGDDVRVTVIDASRVQAIWSAAQAAGTVATGEQLVRMTMLSHPRTGAITAIGLETAVSTSEKNTTWSRRTGELIAGERSRPVGCSYMLQGTPLADFLKTPFAGGDSASTIGGALVRARDAE